VTCVTAHSRLFWRASVTLDGMKQGGPLAHLVAQEGCAREAEAPRRNLLRRGAQEMFLSARLLRNLHKSRV
jgi:hypothetical protein